MRSKILKRYKEYDVNSFNYTDCIECKEGIFNPICPFCLAQEIKAWLDQANNKKLRRIVMQEIRKILNNSFISTFISNKCIKCKNYTSFMCPYCFTEKIYNAIKNSKIKNKKRIREEFLTFFNFDFEHTGYGKELE